MQICQASRFTYWQWTSRFSGKKNVVHVHLNTQQQDSKTKAVFIDVRLCLYIWLAIKGQRDGIADWNIWTISFWPKFPLPRRWNV